MSVTDKLKALLSLAGLRGVDLAEALGVGYNAAANRMYVGVKRVDDLIKIVSACGATLTITTKDGMQIPLTLEDIEEPKKKTKE